MAEFEEETIDPGKYSVKELLKKNYWDNIQLKTDVKEILDKIDVVVKNWEEKHSNLQVAHQELREEFENEKGKKAGATWILGIIMGIVGIIQFFILLSGDE